MCIYARTIFSCSHESYGPRVKMCTIGEDFASGTIGMDCAYKQFHGLQSRRLSDTQCSRCTGLELRLTVAHQKLDDAKKGTDGDGGFRKMCSEAQAKLEQNAQDARKLMNKELQSLRKRVDALELDYGITPEDKEGNTGDIGAPIFRGGSHIEGEMEPECEYLAHLVVSSGDCTVPQFCPLDKFEEESTNGSATTCSEDTALTSLTSLVSLSDMSPSSIGNFGSIPTRPGTVSGGPTALDATVAGKADEAKERRTLPVKKGVSAKHQVKAKAASKSRMPRPILKGPPAQPAKPATAVSKLPRVGSILKTAGASSPALKRLVRK